MFCHNTFCIIPHSLLFYLLSICYYYHLGSIPQDLVPMLLDLHTFLAVPHAFRVFLLFCLYFCRHYYGKRFLRNMLFFLALMYMYKIISITCYITPYATPYYKCFFRNLLIKFTLAATFLTFLFFKLSNCRTLL